MQTVTAVCVLLGLIGPAPAALPPVTPWAEAPASLADQVAAIKKEYEQRKRQFYDELRAASRDGEKIRQANDAWFKFVREQADRLISLIRDHRDDPAAFDGIFILVGTVGYFLADDLVKLVLDRHAVHPKMGELCFHLRYRTSEEWAERLLKATVNHPVPEARGLAVYALADYCRNRAVSLAGELTPIPEDAKRSFAQAEQHYRDVIQHYADVRTPDGKARLGNKAASELTRLRNLFNLVVGRPAPEIEGEDLDGKPIKLSDYRGKVVLLDFWGHW